MIKGNKQDVVMMETEASVAATVEDRAGKFKGAVFEIRFKEFSKQSIGGEDTA